MERAWYRRLPVVLALAAGAATGFYLLGLVAAALLISDETRPTGVRAGGFALIVWWIWLWSLPGAPPYASFVLLGVAAVLIGRVALGAWRGEERARSWICAATALAAGALAVLSLVPYGVREPQIDENGALVRAIAVHRRDPGIVATRAQVAAARVRVLQRPIYYVVLLEPNGEIPRTGDGEPCFRRSETYQVDGVDGDVRRLGVLDSLPEDGGCLRVKVGTGAEVQPLPAAAAAARADRTAAGA